MADSFVQYPASGLTDTFAIPFGYLDPSHLTVKVNGVTAAFTFPSEFEAKLSAGNPNSGDIVDVRRNTPRTTRQVVWKNASNLTATDLNTSDLQLLYIAQEAFDAADNTIQLAADNTYDADNKRIKNIAAPTNPNDAVNKAYVDANTVDIVEVVTEARDVTVAARDEAVASNASAIDAADRAETAAENLEDLNASLISYDNTESGLDATEIQSAIDELAAQGSTPTTPVYGTFPAGSTTIAAGVAFATAANVRLVVGGVAQNPGTDYTVSGTNIILTSASEEAGYWVGFAPATSVIVAADLSVTEQKLGAGAATWAKINSAVKSSLSDILSNVTDKLVTVNALRSYLDVYVRTNVTANVALSGQTSVDFLNIPAGTKRFTLNFDKVRNATVNNPLMTIQLGTASGLETTGYDSMAAQFGSGPNPSTTSAIILFPPAAGYINASFEFVMSDEATNTWIMNETYISTANTGYLQYTSKSLAGPLTQLRLAMPSGTFSSGKISVTYN